MDKLRYSGIHQQGCPQFRGRRRRQNDRQRRHGIMQRCREIQGGASRQVTHQRHIETLAGAFLVDRRQQDLACPEACGTLGPLHHVEPGVFATEFQAKEYGFSVSPPYDELEREWANARSALGAGSAPGPEPVAQAIADAIESDDPRLRWPVGDDAEMILATRATSTDEEFEATMRGALGLTW